MGDPPWQIFSQNIGSEMNTEWYIIDHHREIVLSTPLPFSGAPVVTQANRVSLWSGFSNTIIGD